MRSGWLSLWAQGSERCSAVLHHWQPNESAFPLPHTTSVRFLCQCCLRSKTPLLVPAPPFPVSFAGPSLKGTGNWCRKLRGSGFLLALFWPGSFPWCTPLYMLISAAKSCSMCGDGCCWRAVVLPVLFQTDWGSPTVSWCRSRKICALSWDVCSLQEGRKRLCQAVQFELWQYWPKGTLLGFLRRQLKEEEAVWLA